MKRSVDAVQLLGMLHKQSCHSLVPAWFAWLGAGAVSWLRGVEGRLVETSVVEQQYRAVGGEGQKVCCGRCGAMLGCSGRRYTSCLPVLRQLFRFVVALTHSSQQVDAMGGWS